ncbi:conserved hypothetical protein [Candidatus Desulfosporosinus infrequens]|uniref:Uncharacterized protein n=1 Tax=Candidatus Desulfosporosinus infrequens TaxID=2043169 RepID=A0A2U3KZM4_9FIRM|nr:conserved hypothetical protein [Candidatus Desulfosporosinus infrequens]
MFYRQRQHYHTHGFLFVLSLIAAFLLGRKSEQYGYTIISRGCGCSNEDSEMDMMDDSKTSSSYPQ